MTNQITEIAREVLGDKFIMPLGWHLLLQPYNYGDKFIDPHGVESSFERPDVAKERDQFQLGIGKVLMIGDGCFKSPQFQHWTLFPQPGDYVAYPKYEGTAIKYNGVDCIDIKDYLVSCLVPDPSLFGYYSFAAN